MSIITVASFVVLLTAIPSTLTEDDFRCPKPRGYFPHKTRCDLYYICYGGEYTLESCKKGQLFDDDYKRCLPITSTECGDRIFLTDDTSSSINIDLSTASNDQRETSDQISDSIDWTNDTSETHTTGHEEWNVTTIQHTKTTIDRNLTRPTTENNEWNATQSDAFNSTTTRETEVTTVDAEWNSTSVQDEEVNKTNSPSLSTAQGEWNITSSQNEEANKTSSPSSTTAQGEWNLTSSQAEDINKTSSPAITTAQGEWNVTSSQNEEVNETSSPWYTTEKVEWNVTTSQAISSSSSWSEEIGNTSSTSDASRPGNDTEGATTPTRPSSTEEITTTEEPIEEDELECPEESGLFPHPTDPSMYIHCSAWFPHIKQCPANLVFDPVLEVCAWPQ